MGGLFGSSSKTIPEFTGLQVNTAVQVLPIPIIYGSPRIQMNLIYYNGFYSKTVKSSGKGTLTGGKSSGTVEYFATFIAALGEGPLGTTRIIYQNSEVWTPADYPTNGAYFYPGTDDQAPWWYVATNWPFDQRGYKDTAYYGFSNAQLDSSATVPQIEFILDGFYKGTSPLNETTITISTGQYDSSGKAVSYIGDIYLGFADADPAYVIYDFLVNPRYGATFPAEFVNATSLFSSPSAFTPGVGDQAISTYCQAIGLAWSVVLNNAETASSILERWCKNLGVAIVWDGALLNFIPYWDLYCDLNSGWGAGAGIPKKYFMPFNVAIVAVTVDHILQSESKEEDPITFSRKNPMEVYNSVRVDFKDRHNFFNDVPAEQQDEVHIELYGPRKDNIGTATEFSLSAYANISAMIQLRRNINILNEYSWRMGPMWGWLRPMMVISIPDPTDYTKTLLVRVTSVEDDSDENISIVAEEFPLGSQSPTTFPASQTTPPNQGATNSPPAPNTLPVMFAPTTDMLTATGFASPQWIFGTSGSWNGTLDQNWGGVFVWVSLNGVDYEKVGTLNLPSTIGSLTQPLPGFGGSNPDNVDILTVNLNESDGVLASVSSDAALSGASICCVQDVSGFEILAFTNATLVGPYTYNLSGLYRGLYGTTPRFFGAGSRFLFVGTNANLVEIALPPAYVGQTLWVKAQGFNVFNTATQDLGSVVAYPYLATSPTPVGPVPPPTAPTAARRLAKPLGAVPPISRRHS